MIRRICSAAVAAALAGCAGANQQSPPASLSATPPIVVGENIQVSAQNAARPHGEVQIAADPSRPGHLVACSGVWPLDSSQGIRDFGYQTLDGGKTWNQIYASKVGTEFDLDPICGIAPDGTIFMAGAAASVPVGHDFITRSVDNGAHFAPPLIFSWADRDFMAIDTTHTPSHGRIYYTGTVAFIANGADKGYIGNMSSTDSAKTFSPWVKVTPESVAETTLDYNGSAEAVLPDGNLIVLGYKWPDSATPRPIEAFVSIDHGKTFSAGHLVGSPVGSALINPSSGEKGEGASMIPQIAVDASSGPFHGRAYVLWQDFSVGPEAGIMISSSDDDGKTWSMPIQVDDAPDYQTRQYPIVFSPAFAVNAKGVVAVMWFDGRGYPDGMGGLVRLAISNDGAESFSPSVPIAAAPSLVSPNVPQHLLSFSGGGGGQARFEDSTRYHAFAGDTQGLAADALGGFHPLWTDNRTGVSQIWTASVNTDATGIQHGNAQFASMKDITPKLSLSIRNPVYDSTTQTVSADLVLINSASHYAHVTNTAINGPIYLRATRITSVLGSAQLQSSDNGVLGPGGLIVFRGSSGYTIAPDQMTAPRHITFSLSDTHAITAADPAREALTYVSLRYRTYVR